MIDSTLIRLGNDALRRSRERDARRLAVAELPVVRYTPVRPPSPVWLVCGFLLLVVVLAGLAIADGFSARVLLLGEDLRNPARAIGRVITAGSMARWD